MAKNDHLGEFEQLALLAVMRLGEEAYGARIQEELEARGDRSAAISTIYITLTRLEDKGLVSSTLGSPTDERGGRPRRYFALEAAGLEALRESRERLLAMWGGLEPDLEAGARHGG